MNENTNTEDFENTEATKQTPMTQRWEEDEAPIVVVANPQN